MASRLSPISALGSGQLARYSTAPLSTVLYVADHAPDALASYWIATARGTYLAPEGSTRQAHRFEGSRSAAVLLKAVERKQLALLEAAAQSPVYDLTPDRLPIARQRAAYRTFERHMRKLAEIGLLHRCTRSAEATLYLRPHEEGEQCEWSDCPIGVFTLPTSRKRTSSGDATSVMGGRSERHPVTLATGGESGSTESPMSPAEMDECPTSPRDADNRLQQRMNEGRTALSPEEEAEALQRVKDVLGAKDVDRSEEGLRA